MNKKTVTILLAEADDNDRYLIGEALDESHIDNQLFIVDTGEDLLNFLKGCGKYQDRETYPRPNLILLDLDMPQIDSHETLMEIKKDSALRRIPIIVLTNAQVEEDIQDTYERGITGFITKPMTFNELVEVMKSVGNYWFQSLTLPGDCD
jgi:CheY-like chemotaxis protein